LGVFYHYQETKELGISMKKRRKDTVMEAVAVYQPWVMYTKQTVLYLFTIPALKRYSIGPAKEHLDAYLASAGDVISH
jgi:hypothetical protein